MLLSTADSTFIQKNAPLFGMQVVVIGILIYFTAPKLLFKKKYLLFIITSLAVVAICSLLISGAFLGAINGPIHPPIRPTEVPQFERPTPRPRPIGPPQILIQFLALGFAYIIATFVETFLFAQKKEDEVIKNKNQNLQTELKLLKSQINPHFLFNSLNNIYALSAIDSSKTQESISYLSDMLRYVLYECEQELVPLEKELVYIKNYIKLFCLKSSKSYPITTDFKVLNPLIKVVPMLFIPFMENALKHSNIEKITNTFIRIKIHATEKEIQFEIENSIPQEPINKDAVGGIGIENVKRRLAILYPDRHKLHIKKGKGTFRVQLQINLNETS